MRKLDVSAQVRLIDLCMDICVDGNLIIVIAAIGIIFVHCGKEALLSRGLGVSA